MNDATSNPFAGDIPEIRLSDAPLARVVAQVRYPRPLDFEDDKSLEPLGRILVSRYPVGRKVQATAVLITPSGVTEQPTPETNWTYQDVKGEWQITVSSQFTSIEALKYTSRDEFCNRFREALEALSQVIRPPVFDRLGVRYVNRLEGEEVLKDLDKLVNPTILGGLAVPHEGIEVQHSVCDTVFIDGNSHLQVRWGWLPAGLSVDPSTPAPKAPYWLLDIDSFAGSGGPFEVEVLDSLTRDLATRAYRFFRWSVTDNFMARFGGSA